MGWSEHLARLNTAHGTSGYLGARIVNMDDQFSIARSSLSFTPSGNLGKDFIDVVARVKGASLRQQRDDMKPSNA
jgi:hypothetical protein